MGSDKKKECSGLVYNILFKEDNVRCQIKQFLYVLSAEEWSGWKDNGEVGVLSMDNFVQSFQICLKELF